VGSGTWVSDFTSFCEGDVDPTLNKKIQTLIDRETDYLVYLDEDLYAEWTFNGDTPSGFEDVANRIGRLETLSITQLLPNQRAPFERLLAESMARVLGDKNEEKAKAVLDEAEAYLKARGTENARRWYLGGVARIGLPALVIAGALLLALKWVPSGVWREVLEILGGTALGALGAFLSVASRTEGITFEPVAGPDIHRFEGGIRVVVGMAGALFVALAIKSDLLLGILHSLTHPFLAMLLACLVGGASERLVPGLIDTMGKSMHSRGK
jgi:hypothetical protein